MDDFDIEIIPRTKKIKIDADKKVKNKNLIKSKKKNNKQKSVRKKRLVKHL